MPSASGCRCRMRRLGTKTECFSAQLARGTAGTTRSAPSAGRARPRRLATGCSFAMAVLRHAGEKRDPKPKKGGMGGNVATGRSGFDESVLSAARQSPCTSCCAQRVRRFSTSLASAFRTNRRATNGPVARGCVKKRRLEVKNLPNLCDLCSWLASAPLLWWKELVAYRGTAEPAARLLLARTRSRESCKRAGR